MASRPSVRHRLSLYGWVRMGGVDSRISAGVRNHTMLATGSRVGWRITSCVWRPVEHRVEEALHG